MNIFLDLELEPGFEPKNRTREAIAMAEGVKDFYKERMKVLKDEIEKEENAQLLLHKVAFIVIPMKYEKNPISYFNYSKKLVKKMKGCYSPDDANYLNDKLQEILNSFNN